jgi:hypothetical protein
MQLYKDATPTITLEDNTQSLDFLRSAYVDLRYGAILETTVTIDSRYEANLPGLAFDYYGDQELWRAILAFNGLTDPLNDIIVGVQLRMPSQSSIDAYFATNSSNLNPTLSL